jgi:hypothetical protein
MALLVAVKVDAAVRQHNGGDARVALVDNNILAICAVAQRNEAGQQFSEIVAAVNEIIDAAVSGKGQPFESTPAFVSAFMELSY